MGLIRSVISMALLGLFIFIGFTVPIGKRTLFGHIGNIWSSEATQELVDGVKDESGPFVDRVKRGVKAGMSDDDEETEKPSGSDTPEKNSEPSEK
ncbi:MAG: hypothetical protein JKY56_14660 [Kofleriaceae bacterium]|nr:hypothetical protein [Kofleriaceae bacterium]